MQSTSKLTPAEQRAVRYLNSLEAGARQKQKQWQDKRPQESSADFAAWIEHDRMFTSAANFARGVREDFLANRPCRYGSLPHEVVAGMVGATVRSMPAVRVKINPAAVAQLRQRNHNAAALEAAMVQARHDLAVFLKARPDATESEKARYVRIRASVISGVKADVDPIEAQLASDMASWRKLHVNAPQYLENDIRAARRKILTQKMQGAN